MFLLVAPSGKVSVPVTLPIGIRFFLPNGSHCMAVTSLYFVTAFLKVMLTSNFRPLADEIEGMFQPISTVRCWAEVAAESDFNSRSTRAVVDSPLPLECFAVNPCVCGS